MSNRYTAKVAESLKLRGWIDEIQAESLRADNARKDAEIVRLKGEVEKAKQERNAEGVRQRNIYLPQLHARDKALDVAVKALQAANSMPICASCNEVPQALATLNSLLGDKCGVATPPPDNQKGGS